MKIRKYLCGIVLATTLCIGTTASAAVVSIQPNKNIGVYTSDQEVTFKITRDTTVAETFTYTVEDLVKKVVRNGQITVEDSKTEFSICYGTFVPGWYRVRLYDPEGAEVDIFASFTVVEKINNKPVSSPFSISLHGFSGMDNAKIPDYANALGIVGFDTVRDATSWSHRVASDISKTVDPITENGGKVLLTYEIPKAYIDDAEMGYKGDLYAMNSMLRNQTYSLDGKVAAYEIINEPDLASRNAKFSADVFSSYYKAAALGIEEGMPSTLKSFGGLASGANEFGEILMQNGVANYTDSLNVHSHSNYKQSAATISFGDTQVKKMKTWAAIYGNNQPVWNTEAGINTPVESNDIIGEDSMKAQAKYAITSIVESVCDFGAENHVWFLARHYLENGVNWGTTTPENATYSAYYSLAMLIRGLGEGKPIGKLIGASEGVTGYFFNTGDNDAVVLWGDSETTTYQQLRTSKPVVVKKLIGGTEHTHGSLTKNVVNIPVTSEPVIVIFDGRADERDYIKKTFESSYERDITRTIGEKVVTQAIWEDEEIEISNGRYVLVPGETHNITLNIYNFNNEAVSGNITLTTDSEIEIIGSATQAFSVSAKEDKTITSLNYTIKVKDDADNQFRGSFSFGGDANGTKISETVCGYIVEQALTRDNIGTITSFTAKRSGFSTKMWTTGNASTGIKNESISPNGKTATFSASFNDAASLFWHPVLNANETIPANSDGIVLDVEGISLGTGTELTLYAHVSDGAYAVKLGDLEEGKKTIVIPWKKMYVYNGDIPETLDPGRITKIAFGFQTRKTGETIKYTVSNPGYYVLNDKQEVVVEDFVTFTGISDRGVYREGRGDKNLNIIGNFDEIFLNYESFNGYTKNTNGATIALSELEPGAYSVIVTRNVGFGKKEYKGITFCIKASDDYTPDGVFY